MYQRHFVWPLLIISLKSSIPILVSWKRTPVPWFLAVPLKSLVNRVYVHVRCRSHVHDQRSSLPILCSKGKTAWLCLQWGKYVSTYYPRKIGLSLKTERLIRRASFNDIHFISEIKIKMNPQKKTYLSLYLNSHLQNIELVTPFVVVQNISWTQFTSKLRKM